MRSYQLYTYNRSDFTDRTLEATVDANRPATAIKRHFGAELKGIDSKTPNNASLLDGRRVQAVRVG